MYSIVASTIFAARNANKTKDGEVGRSAVTLGQTAGVLQEVAKYDNIIANGARSAISVFSDLAKQNKAFEYAGKVTKFAVNNVNPLICVSSGIKTLSSDDKVKTGITEVAALTAMFAGENTVKKHYDKLVSSQTVKDELKKLSDKKFLKPVFNYIKKNGHGNKVAMILKGLIFVTASMTSYSIGQKIGERAADKIKGNSEHTVKSRKIDQKA